MLDGGPRHETQDPHLFATPSGPSTHLFPDIFAIELQILSYRPLTRSNIPFTMLKTMLILICLFLSPFKGDD